mmetsp:Transcript_99531/g.285919  ORF Transcript_99531/g.285919 Transcript_99531/m.285919 type:complete len:377 (+) Transcript_99531:214-1344(+)
MAPPHGCKGSEHNTTSAVPRPLEATAHRDTARSSAVLVGHGLEGASFPADNFLWGGALAAAPPPRRASHQRCELQSARRCIVLVLGGRRRQGSHAHRRDLQLLPVLQLAFGAEVAVVAIRAALATALLPEPRARPAIPSRVVGGALGLRGGRRRLRGLLRGGGVDKGFRRGRRPRGHAIAAAQIHIVRAAVHVGRHVHGERRRGRCSSARRGRRHLHVGHRREARRRHTWKGPQHRVHGAEGRRDALRAGRRRGRAPRSRAGGRRIPAGVLLAFLAPAAGGRLEGRRGRAACEAPRRGGEVDPRGGREVRPSLVAATAAVAVLVGGLATLLWSAAGALRHRGAVLDGEGRRRLRCWLGRLGRHLGGTRSLTGDGAL